MQKTKADTFQITPATNLRKVAHDIVHSANNGNSGRQIFIALDYWGSIEKRDVLGIINLIEFGIIDPDTVIYFVPCDIIKKDVETVINTVDNFRLTYYIK